MTNTQTDITEVHAQPITAVDRARSARELIVALTPTIQKNYIANINGKKYIMVAGAQALASAMGYTVRITSCQHKVATDIAGHWEAVAVVIDAANGIELGSGFGHVFDDENMWKGRPRFAQAAMCQTRATGRALKSCIGWMFALVGAEGSFLEEMPDDRQPQSSAAPRLEASPSNAYKPPPVKAAEPRLAAARAQASEGILEETIIVESAKVVKGTTGAGKAYTRWVIEWLIDGAMCKGATFSATAGEMCVQAQKTRDQVYIEYTLGQYGKDIKTASLVDPMSKSERIAADETIPF